MCFLNIFGPQPDLACPNIADPNLINVTFYWIWPGMILFSPARIKRTMDQILCEDSLGKMAPERLISAFAETSSTKEFLRNPTTLPPANYQRIHARDHICQERHIGCVSVYIYCVRSLRRFVSQKKNIKKLKKTG
jgi:hypothetical protein